MPNSKREVVLVEDDIGMRRAVTRMLSTAGYEVRVFDSAEALLDELAGDALWAACSCMVCDVRLPGVSGFELHRRLSERGRLPPWIFITAFDNQPVREQANQAMATCLTKPFEGRTLLALIARLLG